jgi:hypothetical protein
VETPVTIQLALGVIHKQWKARITRQSVWDVWIQRENCIIRIAVGERYRGDGHIDGVVSKDCRHVEVAYSVYHGTLFWIYSYMEFVWADTTEPNPIPVHGY